MRLTLLVRVPLPSTSLFWTGQFYVKPSLVLDMCENAFKNAKIKYEVWQKDTVGHATATNFDALRKLDMQATLPNLYDNVGSSSDAPSSSSGEKRAREE